MDDGHWNMKIYYLSKGNFTLKKKKTNILLSLFRRNENC